MKRHRTSSVAGLSWSGCVAASGALMLPGLAEAQASALTVATFRNLASAIVPPSASTVVVQGYLVPGDLGAATYRRVADPEEQALAARSADGSSWVIADDALRPEMFGAVADGHTDSAPALTMALAYGRTVQLQAGHYVVGGQVTVNRGGSTLPVVLVGAGLGESLVEMVFFGTGLAVQGNPAIGTPVTLKDFTIFRTNADSFVGTIGKHSINISFGNGVMVAGVEEYGAIGMGILLDKCRNFEVADCYVHDHKGGGPHLSGTDGIHHYRCPGPGKTHNNRVERIGDDGISFGSYDAAYQLNNVLCYENRLQRYSRIDQTLWERNQYPDCP